MPGFFVDHGDQGTPRAFTGALIIPRFVERHLPVIRKGIRAAMAIHVSTG